MRTDAEQPTTDEAGALLRYRRQIVFEPFGLAGQRALTAGRVLIVGVGGLGSWVAELLARAGVGMLRLVDDDRVELTNIHRQGLYDESDAQRSLPKVQAAAERLGGINSHTATEPVNARLDRGNIDSLAGDVDVIVDGTDNFATRFLINDYAVKSGKPWVFAGVVGSEAQIMSIVPGRTACLRCVLDSLPPACRDPNCRSFGVLGPAVAAVAAFQAAEVMKILAGKLDHVSGRLLKFDTWTNDVQQMEVEADGHCRCCGQREFEFLEP